MAATTAIVNLELPTLYCEAFPSNAFLRLPLPEPTGTINALPAGRRGHEWQGASPPGTHTANPNAVLWKWRRRLPLRQ